MVTVVVRARCHLPASPIQYLYTHAHTINAPLVYAAERAATAKPNQPASRAEQSSVSVALFINSAGLAANACVPPLSSSSSSSSAAVTVAALVCVCIGNARTHALLTRRSRSRRRRRYHHRHRHRHRHRRHHLADDRSRYRIVVVVLLLL